MPDEPASSSIGVLQSAGWEPGRRVAVDRWRDSLESEGFVVHEAAQRFLSEFGGLSINISGPGIDHALEPFELDPTLCSGEADRFEDWGRRAGKVFSPLGELNYGHAFLAADEDGMIYVMADNLDLLDVGVRALEMLIRGNAGTSLGG